MTPDELVRALAQSFVPKVNGTKPKAWMATEGMYEGKLFQVGDRVHVLPSADNKLDGFSGKVLGLGMRGDTVVWVDVWGGRPGYESNRSIWPWRVEILTERKKRRSKADV